MNPVLAWCAAITAIGGALVILARGSRALARALRRIVHMADEVLGDGSEERPGWSRRLERIELRVDGMDARLERVEDAVTHMPVALRGDNGRAGQRAREAHR